MQTLAHWSGDGGPGPWILLFPLIWATVIASAVLLVRRTARRAGWGPWRAVHAGAPRPGAENTPVDLLGRRFAAGEIDEDEYWRRLSVLNESANASAHERKIGRRGGAA